MVRHAEVIGSVIALLTATEGHCARPCELLTRLEKRGAPLFHHADRTRRLRALNWHLWAEADRPGSRLRHGARGHYALTGVMVISQTKLTIREKSGWSTDFSKAIGVIDGLQRLTTAAD